MEGVVFGDFSFDEVQDLRSNEQTAVVFSGPVQSASDGRITINHSSTTSSDSGVVTGPTSITSPEFQFSLSSPSGSLTEYADQYQFGCSTSTLSPSTTSPSSLSATPSSSSINSGQSGRSPAKLNVFAKEFVPSNPSNLSIITKNEVGVDTHGSFHVPQFQPIPTQPFMFHPFNPVMVPFMPDPASFPQPFPLHTIGHTTAGFRSTGPQVAVVAPYHQTPRDHRQSVPPIDKKNRDKYKRSNFASDQNIPVSNQSHPNFNETEGIDISQVKSVSLSPPLSSTSSHTSTMVNRRSSSTGDIDMRIFDLNNSPNDTPNRTTPTPEELADTHPSTQPISTTPISSDNKILSPEDSTAPEKSVKPDSPVNKPVKPDSPVDKPVKPDSPVDIPVKPDSPVDKPVDSPVDEPVDIPIDKPVKPDSPVDKPVKVDSPVDKPVTNSPVLSHSKHSQSPTPVSKSPSPPPSPPSIESTTTLVNVPSPIINTGKNDQKSPSPVNSHTSTIPTNNKETHSPPAEKVAVRIVNVTDKKINDKKSSNVPPPSRSWASVVGTASLVQPPKSLSNVEVQVQGKPVAVVGVVSKTSVPEVSQKDDESELEEVNRERLKFFGDQIKDKAINHDPVSILPRGLSNSGNMCYMHAPLQALISCPAFSNLLRYLKLPKESSPSSTATIATENMIKFMQHFQNYPKPSSTDDGKNNGRRKKGQRDFSYENPFRPEFMYEILPKIQSHLSIQGRQEDAEEFLGCILNKLHDEMVAAIQSVATPTSSETTDSTTEEEGLKDEEEEWQEVGPKNKLTIKRQTVHVDSPISEIFGGKQQSSLHRHGMKVSATVEPFFSLQLDIQSDEIWTVKDALEFMASKEAIHLSDKDEIGATRRTTLVHLPPVLILHLKRFIFDGSKPHKLHKIINYEVDLEIPKDLLAPTVKGKLTLSQRSYKLWAVVYHNGDTPNGGHYTCDTYHPPSGGWLRFDDNYVKPVFPDQVFHTGHRVPYLFFYRQVDTIHSRC